MKLEHPHLDPPPKKNTKKRKKSQAKSSGGISLRYGSENMAFVFESLSWIPHIFEYYLEWTVIGYGLRKRESPIKVDS